MCTVGTATLLGCLVDLDMLDHTSLQIQPLLLSITLDILQQSQQELAALLRPSSLAHPVHLGLGTTAHTAAETAKGDALLLLHHVGQVALGLEEGHPFDGLGGLTGVLEVDTQVVALGLASL